MISVSSSDHSWRPDGLLTSDEREAKLAPRHPFVEQLVKLLTLSHREPVLPVADLSCSTETSQDLEGLGIVVAAAAAAVAAAAAAAAVVVVVAAAAAAAAAVVAAAAAAAVVVVVAAAAAAAAAVVAAAAAVVVVVAAAAATSPASWTTSVAQ